VHQLLNGSVRNYIDCYPTSGVGGRGAGRGGRGEAAPPVAPPMSLKDRAAATIAARISRLPH